MLNDPRSFNVGVRTSELVLHDVVIILAFLQNHKNEICPGEFRRERVHNG